MTTVPAATSPNPFADAYVHDQPTSLDLETLLEQLVCNPSSDIDIRMVPRVRVLTDAREILVAFVACVEKREGRSGERCASRYFTCWATACARDPSTTHDKFTLWSLSRWITASGAPVWCATPVTPPAQGEDNLEVVLVAQLERFVSARGPDGVHRDGWAYAALPRQEAMS